MVALVGMAAAVHHLAGDGEKAPKTPADEPVPENL
jgi:hypothetical protein